MNINKEPPQEKEEIIEVETDKEINGSLQESGEPMPQ